MRALAVGLALSTLLAGCLANDDGAPAPASTSNVTDCVAGAICSPDGFAPVANASDAGGHLPHVHDYWAGADRFIVLDRDVEPGVDDVAFRTLFNSFFRKEARAGGTFVALPDNVTVYEGTGELVLTATWADPKITAMEVAWRSGEGPAFSAFAPLTSGEALSIPVSPEMTDMPHMRVSRWGFVFEPTSQPAGAALGPFHVTIEIVRVRDVMEFPAHPDHFEGADAKVLHEAPGKSAQVSYAKRVPNVLTSGEFTEHWITPTQIVPMATKSMRAEVLVTKAEASVGTVGEIRFFWTTAGNTNIQRAEPVEGSLDEKRIVFEFPVEPEDSDSPYADESQWRFLVEAATDNPGPAGGNTCGGCVDTDIEFVLKVTASKAETAVEPMDAN